MTEERFVKGDTYRARRSLGEHPEFGIHHLGPEDVEHGQQIKVYGRDGKGRELRDLIIRLLNRHLDEQKRQAAQIKGE